MQIPSTPTPNPLQSSPSIVLLLLLLLLEVLLFLLYSKYYFTYLGTPTSDKSTIARSSAQVEQRQRQRPEILPRLVLLRYVKQVGLQCNAGSMPWNFGWWIVPQSGKSDQDEMRWIQKGYLWFNTRA